MKQMSKPFRKKMHKLSTVDRTSADLEKEGCSSDAM